MHYSFSYKKEIATEIVKDAGFLGEFKATVLSDLFSDTFMYLIRIPLVMGYALRPAAMFVRFLVKKRERLVFPAQNFMIKWPCLSLGFLILLTGCHLVSIFMSFSGEGSDVFFTINILQVLSAIGLTGLLASQFLFASILYGSPHFPLIIAEAEPVRDLEDSSATGTRKSTINLEINYLPTIDQKSGSFIKESRPYLQPDYNLAWLSVNIQMPVHHPACFFREYKKQSFSDFRDEWRVRHAGNLIMEGKTGDMTLEALALESGFLTLELVDF